MRPILAASAKLFSQKGFDGTTVQEIADEADIAVGTLLFLFLETLRATGFSRHGIQNYVCCTTQREKQEQSEDEVPSIQPRSLSKRAFQAQLRDTHGPNPNCFQLSRKATMGFTFVARRAGR